ncbi:MAG: protoporphyrinogen oxidase HemJ [Candidatus Latescibacteria bacterium]|nr:protoporphyrinogen oxidase HemJ [Candidatus Latescibacterota bacterium]
MPYLVTIHLIAVILWLVGMLYLPRIFVYHAQVQPGSEADGKFREMERGLMVVVLNPAMIVSFITGILLIVAMPVYMQQGWMHTKLLLVVMMGGLHGMMSKYRKDFDKGQNTRGEGFFRTLNKIPGILMVLIVWLVIMKPF